MTTMRYTAPRTVETEYCDNCGFTTDVHEIVKVTDKRNGGTYSVCHQCILDMLHNPVMSW